MERETEIRYSPRMARLTELTPEELAKKWEGITGKKMVGLMDDEGTVFIKPMGGSHKDICVVDP